MTSLESYDSTTDIAKHSPRKFTDEKYRLAWSMRRSAFMMQIGYIIAFFIVLARHKVSILRIMAVKSFHIKFETASHDTWDPGSINNISISCVTCLKQNQCSLAEYLSTLPFPGLPFGMRQIIIGAAFAT